MPNISNKSGGTAALNHPRTEAVAGDAQRVAGALARAIDID